MPTATKKELARKVAQDTGCTYSLAIKMVDALFAAMRDALIEGNRIEIPPEPWYKKHMELSVGGGSGLGRCASCAQADYLWKIEGNPMGPSQGVPLLVCKECWGLDRKVLSANLKDFHESLGEGAFSELMNLAASEMSSNP